ncbi:hypothetical protein ES708_07806 [subsurface metagenome]
MQTATAKVIIYEGSILPGHGSVIATKTAPPFSISPGQTYNVIVHHTAIAGTIDRRDVEVEVYIAGNLIKQSEWDDIYYVTAPALVTIVDTTWEVSEIGGVLGGMLVKGVLTINSPKAFAGKVVAGIPKEADDTFAYSGWEGGEEYINSDKPLNRAYDLKVYCYEAGDYTVTVSYVLDSSLKAETFTGTLAKKETALLTTIPAGATELRITLSATADLDLNLYDGDTFVIGFEAVIDSKGSTTGTYPVGFDMAKNTLLTPEQHQDLIDYYEQKRSECTDSTCRDSYYRLLQRTRGEPMTGGFYDSGINGRETREDVRKHHIDNIGKGVSSRTYPRLAGMYFDFPAGTSQFVIGFFMKADETRYWIGIDGETFYCIGYKGGVFSPEVKLYEGATLVDDVVYTDAINFDQWHTGNRCKLF